LIEEEIKKRKEGIFERLKEAGKLGQVIAYTIAGIGITTFFILFILSSPFLPILSFPYLTYVDFLILSFLSGTGAIGGYRYIRMRRIKKINERFPDFVRDLAESRRSGLTFVKAIMLTSKGSYGELTPEIKRICSAVSWGSSVEDALDQLAERVDTKLVRRTVSLINEASRGGGNVADVLETAARDAREIATLQFERRNSMFPYLAIIYIGAFAFIAIILVLTKSIFPRLGGIGGVAGFGGGSSLTVSDLIPVFFSAAFVQALGSGVIAGVFESGRPISGVKHSFILTLTTWLVFKIATLTGVLPPSGIL
jgi:flagellar protein FlaJ